jgi:hypothetical protein
MQIPQLNFEDDATLLLMGAYTTDKEIVWVPLARCGQRIPLPVRGVLHGSA